MKITKVFSFSLILVLMFSVVISEVMAQNVTNKYKSVFNISPGAVSKSKDIMFPIKSKDTPESKPNTKSKDTPESEPKLVSSFSAGLRSLLDEFAADGAVVKMTDKTTKQIRDKDGVLVEIVTTINGESRSGQVTEEISQKIRQVKADKKTSLTVISATIIKSIETDDEGSSYEQVQIIPPCDADGDGYIDMIKGTTKPKSQLVIGWTKKDGKTVYFGTVQTDMVYKRGEVVSSTNSDVSEMTREQARKLAEEVGLPDLVPYAEGV